MQTDRLIQDYRARGHPLGEALTMEEAGNLIPLLRQRLGVTEQDLDLSPSSLKRLGNRLSDYHRSLQESGRALSDDDVVQFVREIAAYFGIVLVRHAQGSWEGGPSLWQTSISIEGPIKVIKGSTRYMSEGKVLLLGNQAATAWDLVTQGLASQLYSSYLSARRRVVSERLGNRRLTSDTPKSDPSL